MTVLLLLLCGCGREEAAQAPVPLSDAPEGVMVSGDTARVAGFATADAAGGAVAEPEQGPEVGQWLSANGFRYVGFEVDTAATRELRSLGLAAEDSTRVAVYGLGEYVR